MKENQNSSPNASEVLPNFQGMSLLAILRQGSGLLLKEALEAEITEHLGRLRYEHGAEFRGHRNGYCAVRAGVTGTGRKFKLVPPRAWFAPDFSSDFFS